MQIITYNENFKNQVIRFAQKMWNDLGKTWEPNDRDKDFFDIPGVYQISGGEFWIVLDDENTVIGTVALKPLKDGESELKRLYVASAYRGQGIGRDLLQRVIIQAKKKGFKNIKLDTSKKLTSAYALFQKIGFREINPYFDDERSEVFMELTLTIDSHP